MSLQARLRAYDVGGRLCVSGRRPRVSRRSPRRQEVSRACGIVGVVLQPGSGGCSKDIYEALLMLQHRGQDASGMVTYDGTHFTEIKDKGLV